MESMSLLYALLEVESKNPQERYNAIQQNPETHKKVQDQLYRTLYVITEYPDLPQHKQLNMAIGRILARAIAEKIPTDETPAVQEAIQALRETLLRAVTDAIKDLDIPPV